MKWLNINGILTEIKRIRWPKAKDLARDSVTVFGFMALLVLFFYLYQVVSSGFLKLIRTVQKIKYGRGR